MLKVRLARDWFGPEDTYYRAENNGATLVHEFPDDWLKELPSTALVEQSDGKTWKRVRELRGEDRDETRPAPVEVSPPPHKELDTVVGGVDQGVMAGTKDTLSPPPNAPGGNRPANPPGLTEAVNDVDEIGANAGPNPGTAPPNKAPEAKPKAPDTNTRKV